MRIPRLYLPADYTEGAKVSLTKEQAHYALTVLRLKNQHPLELFDGKGQIAEATLEVLGRRDAEVRLKTIKQAANESPLTITLLQGISRGDRMDYSLQKAVELGVTSIQPLFTDRCEVKLKGDKLEKRREQWQNIVISACEQSGRAFVPEVLPIKSLNEILAEPVKGSFGIVCDPYASQSLSSLQLPQTDDDIQILVGPEGGLSDEEVGAAVKHRFHAVQLGPRILRTETAGPAIIAIIQALWGDLN